MSIYIMVEGRLWGLMIGHHRRPHYVTPETRSAATVQAPGPDKAPAKGRKAQNADDDDDDLADVADILRRHGIT